MVQREPLRTNSESYSGKAQLQKYCIFYVILWCICPPLQIDLIFRLLALGAVVVWFAVEMSSSFLFTSFELAAICYALEAMAVTTIRLGYTSILKQISVYMLVLMLIVNKCYRGRLGELGNIHLVVISLFTLFNILTYSELLVNPEIARSLVRDTPELYVYYRRGVGGYALIYPQICIAAVGFQWAVSQFKKSKLKSCLGLVWILSLFLTVMEAGYSIAIVTFAISLVVLLLYHGKNPLPAIVIALALFIGMLYALVRFESLQNWLLEVFDGTAVSKKINDLISSVNDGETEGSIKSRVDRYLMSINGYISNPIVGTFGTSVGSHSAILDSFATYGLMGIVYVRTLVFEQFKEKRKTTDNKAVIRAINAAMVAIMLVGALDTVTYQFSAPIMVLIPLFLRDIDGEEIENVEKDESSLDGKPLPD